MGFVQSNWQANSYLYYFATLCFTGRTLQVPCVPWIPALSIFTCLSLMVSVATVTSWVGLAVVLGLGENVTITHHGLKLIKKNLCRFQLCFVR